jgi:hypothetical protein
VAVNTILPENRIGPAEVVKLTVGAWVSAGVQATTKAARSGTPKNSFFMGILSKSDEFSFRLSDATFCFD